MVSICNFSAITYLPPAKVKVELYIHIYPCAHFWQFIDINWLYCDIITHLIRFDAHGKLKYWFRFIDPGGYCSWQKMSKNQQRLLLRDTCPIEQMQGKRPVYLSNRHTWRDLRLHDIRYVASSASFSQPTSDELFGLCPETREIKISLLIVVENHFFTRLPFDKYIAAMLKRGLRIFHL